MALSRDPSTLGIERETVAKNLPNKGFAGAGAVRARRTVALDCGLARDNAVLRIRRVAAPLRLSGSPRGPRIPARRGEPGAVGHRHE